MTDHQNGNMPCVALTSSLDFAGIDDIPNPQITEAVFIREFLKLVLDTDLPEDVLIAHNARWLHYAKSPYSPMDVTRDGQVIYTVPPLFDSSASVLNELGESGGFRLLIRTVDEQNKVAAIYGGQVLNAYLGNYANRERVVNPRIAAAWRHILDFYGLAERVVKAHTGQDLTASKGVTSVSEPNFGDSSDFDEDC